MFKDNKDAIIDIDILFYVVFNAKIVKWSYPPIMKRNETTSTVCLPNYLTKI